MVQSRITFCLALVLLLIFGCHQRLYLSQGDNGSSKTNAMLVIDDQVLIRSIYSIDNKTYIYNKKTAVSSGTYIYLNPGKYRIEIGLFYANGVTNRPGENPEIQAMYHQNKIPWEVDFQSNTKYRICFIKTESGQLSPYAIAAGTFKQ